MARTRPAVRMGVLNLLVMVIALSLAVLAVLSLATARAGQALAEREQQSVQEVYSCEAAGQRFLAALDDELAPARKAGGGSARSGEALQTGLADLQQQAVAGAEGLSAQVELLEGQDASALEGALRGGEGHAPYVLRTTFATESRQTLTCVVAVSDDGGYEVLQWRHLREWGEPPAQDLLVLRE